MNTLATQTIDTGRPAEAPLRKLLRHREALALPLMFAVAIVLFGAMGPGFFSLDNLSNVARQSVYLLMASLGQLLVLVVGGLDLSIGTVAALASVVGSLVIVALGAHLPPLAAILAGALAAVALGAVIGFLNGFGVAVLRIPSFMVTLGMSSVVFGVALFISGGVPVDGLPPQLGAIFGFGTLLGIPVPALIALFVMVAVYVLLERMRLGRHLYATGGNLRAAALSGVRTTRVGLIAFVLSGALAALTGMLLTAQLGTGETNVGQSLPLQSIAACVIAGVSLAGGKGRVLWVVLGTLLIMLVQNGLDLMQVGAYAANMVVGVILLLAMAISSSARR
jgi:ribose transport system permease protein